MLVHGTNERDIARTSDIYMYNNLTIGSETDVAVNKIRKNRGFKIKKFNGIKMRIECLRRDIKGNFINKQLTEEVNINRLLIANAEKPREWYGPEPHCNSSELEMIYQDMDGAKLEKKHSSKKKKDVKVPFQALYTHLHIGEVVLSS